MSVTKTISNAVGLFILFTQIGFANLPVDSCTPPVVNTDPSAEASKIIMDPAILEQFKLHGKGQVSIRFRNDLTQKIDTLSALEQKDLLEQMRRRPDLFVTQGSTSVHGYAAFYISLSRLEALKKALPKNASPATQPLIRTPFAGSGLGVGKHLTINLPTLEFLLTQPDLVEEISFIKPGIIKIEE